LLRVSGDTDAGGVFRDAAAVSGSPEEGSRIVVAAALVWLTPQRVLVHRRPRDARFGAGALELPGGKLEPREGPVQALARELVEEWGPGARCLTIGPVADVLHHVYPPPGPEVVLVVYHVNGAQLSDAAALTPEPGFVPVAYDVAELPVAEFLAADREWVDGVRAGAVRSPF